MAIARTSCRAFPIILTLVHILVLTLDARPGETYDCIYPTSVCGNVLLNKADASILLQLKPNSLDWNTSLTCGNGWTGVCTDRNGRVTELNLFSFIASSVLPTSFGNLDKLIYLNLGQNLLEEVSILPIAKLLSLRDLDFSGNQLSTLPSSFAALSKLVYLNLNRCKLKDSAFDVITKLKSLKYLDVSANRGLSGIPASISSLSNLTSLVSSSNRLTAIPSSLGQLSKLEYLDLSSNLLTDNIYTTIVKLKSLHTLILASNYLTAIPDTISSLSNLKILSVSGCQLKTVPSSLSALPKLIQLYLNSNDVTVSSISTISKLKQLQILELDSTQIRFLPPSFANLTNLIELSVSYNGLYSNSTTPLLQLKNLVTLNLGENRITTLPSTFSTLKNLQTLYLFKNNLDRSVLPIISSMKNLRTLHLANNPTLRGLIPQLSSLTSLTFLDLSFCSFTGSIPPHFGTYPKYYVSLASNNLCGNIPITFANFSKSGVVDVSYNKLSGTIPASVVSRFCEGLQYVFGENCLVSTNKSCPVGYTKPIASCTAACYPIPDLSKDLAYKATTKQSSTYWVAGSSLAVDGTAGLGSFFNASCTQTLNQTTPWLRIGLSATYKVRIVQIYNRLDCCSARLDGVQVYVGSSNLSYNAAGNSACINPGYKYAPGKKGFPLNVICNKSGKFVWVVVPGVKKILSVCEVVVLK